MRKPASSRHFRMRIGASAALRFLRVEVGAQFVPRYSAAGRPLDFENPFSRHVALHHQLVNSLRCYSQGHSQFRLSAHQFARFLDGTHSDHH